MAKVLIIEDERGIEMLIRRVVGMLGHEAVVAGDGASGCRLAGDQDVALIISDLTLPGAPQGMDLIAALREQRPDCPLVVSTGHTTEDNLAGLREAGVQHVLGKPFDVMELRKLLIEHVGDARQGA